ncbi:hypothetical protein M1563_03230, partial [Patescibacteria group bacterium]|nr:hypothetical protein [Patescibacteria group bacterium]MCL5409242.1 hypothetical protein [Patescibacteria group bacterium]
ITGDLGFGTWDKVRDTYPDRFINTGAAEQSIIGIGTGLALMGKVPIVYSITPFILFRPFEFIRNYIHHEKIPVKIIGISRGREYAQEGYTHWSDEDQEVMEILDNIHSEYPNDSQEVPQLVKKMLEDNQPWYINLKR